MYDVKTVFKASTVTHTLQLLAENPGAVVVCGGTDVMIRLKERKLTEATLISILETEGLQGVNLLPDGTVRIGAGTCFTGICKHPVIQSLLPALGEACNQVGSPQIRNIATIGGNICNGAVSADSVPILYALDAMLEITSVDAVKRIPITGFHTGPGKTILNSQKELLTAILIPKESYSGCGAHYIKFGQRNAMEISTLGCAANAKLSEDKSSMLAFHISFGVAAPTPIRCPKTEAALTGRPIDSRFFQTLRRDVLKEVSPRDSWRASKELRIQLIRELSVRAAKQAIIRAGGKCYD